MRKAIVHIGDYKCGSTSIQETFYNNRKLLSSYHITYSNASNGPNHAWLGFLNDEKKHSNFFGKSLEHSKSFLAKCHQRFDMEIDRNQDNLFVLSSEFISSISLKEISALKTYLSERFDSITIVIYLRNPFDKFKSHIVENVKTGQLSLEKALHDVKFNFSPEKIEKYRAVFGKKNVIIRELKRDKLVSNNLIKDFLSIINVKVEMDEIRSNESISKEALLIADRLITKYPRFSSEHDRFKPALYRIKGDTFKLPQNIALELLEKNKDFFSYYETELGINCEINTRLPESVNANFSDDAIDSIIDLITEGQLSNKEVDNLRDIALALEKVNLDFSVTLMKIAIKNRPEGVFMANWLKKNDVNDVNK